MARRRRPIKPPEPKAEHPNEEVKPTGRRPCPICGNIMVVEREQGISIDVCAEHGIWLDLGEFDQIIRKLKGRLRTHQKVTVQRARRDAKMKGIMWGWWSLFMD